MKFKGSVIMVALLFVCINGVEAGSHGGGIKGGLLISSPSGGDRDNLNVESINTLSFGLFHRYSFTSVISLQTELFYAHKGSKGNIYYRDGEINIYYVDLDTVLQYRIFGRKSSFGNVYLGPVFSFRMDANVKLDTISGAQSYNIKSDIKPYDFGYVVGVKFGLSKGSNEFSIDARYSSGLIAPDDTGNDIDLKNRTITIMFEMYFG